MDTPIISKHLRLIMLLIGNVSRTTIHSLEGVGDVFFTENVDVFLNIR